MKRERLEFAVLILIALIGGGVVLLVLLRHIFPAALPFIIAWCTALAVRGPSRRLSERLKLPERVIRPVLAILIALLLFLFLGLFLWQLITLIWSTLSDIAEGGNPIYDLIHSLSEGDFTIFGKVVPEELAEAITGALGSFLSSALSFVAAGVTRLASALPSALLFVLVTVIAIIYFAIDLEKINARVRRLLPKSACEKLSFVRGRLMSIGKKTVGAYLAIFGITFVRMLLGLLFMRVDAPMLVALIIAFLDLLPVIGVGTVLVPWSIIGFATGDSFIGFGMIILFVVNTVVRELVEPKILGKNLGIHPILSLVLIYAGYALFGFAGLLVTPIIAGVIGVVTERGVANRIGNKEPKPQNNSENDKV
jgi:sporulation integral membrane protein YtvI